MPPNVLVVGSGGREHALVRALARSPRKPALFVAPGNPGTASLAENLPEVAPTAEALVPACRERGIDLVVIGPEDPLIAGLADHLREAGIRVFGPGAAGSRLEGDKEFAKEILASASVPTARFRGFDDCDRVLQYLQDATFPVVIKACGAAQGKGVAVCSDLAAAVAHVDLCLTERRFGDAGARLLVEECLVGPELSVLAVTDGEDYVLLAPSRDHKRVGEGDTGPNTGGMGAFAPVSLDRDLYGRIEEEIIRPVLAELRRRGIPYRGVLYAGLMLTADGPQVLEFNCRFGDPETQVVLPLLAGNFLALIEAAADGELGDFLARASAAAGSPPVAWPGAGLTDWSRHCIVVVGAAPGYPGSYARGEPLVLPADEGDAAWIIQAGTGKTDQGLVTAGGRVLGAVGSGPDLVIARERAYDLLGRVSGADLYFRRDIAARALTAGGSVDG